MAKQKIALYSPSLSGGGAERVALRMADLLAERYDVTIILYTKEHAMYECAYPIISLGVSYGSNSLGSKVKEIFLRMVRLRKVLHDYSFDAVFSFNHGANASLLLCRTPMKKLVSLRGFARVDFAKGSISDFLKRKLFSILYKRADAVVCVSEIMRRHVIDQLQLIPSKVYTLYNGYDTKQIEELITEPCPNSFLEILHTKRVIMAVGSLKYEKGYWHLIRSFSKVLESYKDVQLVILGEGAEGNKEKIISLVKALQIESSVSFLGFDSNPFKYISKSELYVLSSISEGFPNALVEAMVCHVPVVATDCMTGPREILSLDIEKEITQTELVDYGILVPRLEREEIYDGRPLTARESLLAEAISLLLGKTELREEYGKRSFERAKQFSYGKWQEKLFALFDEVEVGTS
ncbi:MAG: glycosyltransferase [Sphaerochaetaceae bacterium]